MDKLTEKQEKVFKYIKEYTRENSFPPTLKELAEKFKVTIGTMQDYVFVLQKKGYVVHEKNTARGFRIIKDTEDDNKKKSEPNLIPLYGNVAAGTPIFADNNIQGYISFEENRRGHKLHFALKVKGDSMVDSGIYDGDIVIVRKQDTADDGDIVIALLEDEATVKRLRKRKINAYLEASNSHYKSIINSPFQVIGKVIELRRKYDIKSL
jgi:repressor LexA